MEAETETEMELSDFVVEIRSEWCPLTHAPSSDELHFIALEQALDDSQARGAKTKEKLKMLLHSFLKLEKLMSEQ